MAKQTVKATPDAGDDLIKVRAVRMGYHDLKRRREGDVFMVPKKRFSSTWMEVVDGRTPERLTTGKEQLQKEHADLRALKSPAIIANDGPTGHANVLG